MTKFNLEAETRKMQVIELSDTFDHLLVTSTS